MTTSPRSRPRPAVAFGGVLVAAAGVAVFAISGCDMPHPRATRQQIAALPRAMLEESPGRDRLSYLHAAPSAAGPHSADGAAEADALPRVIYLHGTPGDATGWADFLVDPVPGLHAFAVDRAGFGRSMPHGAQPSFEAQAAAIAPLLVERAGRWPIVVGHSLGGPIAARLAADNPGRVGGLVIVAGSLDPALERHGFWQRIGTSGIARAIMPRALDNAMGELDAARRETRALQPLLRNIRCPVIIVHGTADELVPFGNVAYMQREFADAPRVDVVTLEKQGHFVPWERPDAIRAAVAQLRDAAGPPPAASRSAGGDQRVAISGSPPAPRLRARRPPP